MPTPVDTLWRYDPHTIAKHKILGSYLKAWAPILSSFNGRIVYIDGFAGPGEDSEHSHYGSPIIALDSVVNHTLRQNFRSEIVMYFVEQREDRAKHLEALIKTKFPKLPPFLNYQVDDSEFLPSLRGILDFLDRENRRLAPAFCFVDPFGWRDLDLDLFSRFMIENKAELFITFMAGFIQRFEEEDGHLPSLRKLFTDDQLREASTKVPEEKGGFLLAAFTTNLIQKISERDDKKKIYSISFETRNSSNNLEYYLIYLTSHEKGMKVMKDAMYSVSSIGEFKFSDFDFDPGQQTLVDYGMTESWPSKAAADLYELVKRSGLLGKEVSAKLPETLVTLETKWVFRKSILKALEDQGKLNYIGKRPRSGSYPDQGKLIFI